MSMRTAVIMLMALAAGASPLSAAFAPSVSALPSEQLVYPGASVLTQLELNGNGAVQLVGGAVDQCVLDLESSAKEAQKQGARSEEGARTRALLSLAGPAKDALKGLTGVKLLVMAPKKQPNSDEFVRHYQGVMATRGWSPLGFLKVRDDGPTIVAMLAPETKGIFVAVRADEDIIAVAFTTEQPLGDLIAKAVRACGGKSPMDLVSGLMGKSPAKVAPKTAPADEKPAAPEAAPDEKPESPAS